MGGAARTRIRLCGRLEAELEGRRVEELLPGRQGRLVLAFLAINRPRPIGRDELIDALWPAAPPADPDEALSALLSKVRRALGKEAIEGRRELALVLPEDAEIDVERAFAHAERADTALACCDWATASDEAAAARAIAKRGFLPGHDAPWVEAWRR